MYTVSSVTNTLTAAKFPDGEEASEYSIRYYQRAPDPQIDDVVTDVLSSLDKLGFDISINNVEYFGEMGNRNEKEILQEEFLSKKDIISELTSYTIEDLLRPNNEFYVAGAIRLQHNNTGIISYLPYLNIYSLPADAIAHLTEHLSEAGAAASLVSLTLTVGKLIRDKLQENTTEYASEVIATTYGHVGRNKSNTEEISLMRDLKNKHNKKLLLFTGWGWKHVRDFSEAAGLDAIITEGCILRELDNGQSTNIKKNV